MADESGKSVTYYFGTRDTITDLSSVVAMNQIHSNIVKYVTEADIGTVISECDGIVTDRENVPLSVKTADCVPLLMWDNSVIAAVHAGWRGTISSIAVNAVDMMISHGAVRENIKVAVGASICFECYEVQSDFYDAVESALGTEFCDMFIRQYNGQLHTDVKGMNLKLLTDNGIKPENITVCPDCTCCNMDKYYSYRGGKNKQEIMRSVIVC